MNKSELIKQMAEENSLSLEEATVFVNHFFDTIKDALKSNDRVEIRGFGSFKLKNYKGYVGRNPKTGAEVDVIPKRLPFFRCGKELYDYVNS